MRPLIPVFILAAALFTHGQAADALKQSLTFHASFDNGLNADFSRGDKACVFRKGKDLVPGAPNDDVKLVAGAGKFGGCLHFPKKGATKPQFSGVNMLGYNDRAGMRRS